jgi:hypothetical protein
VLFVHTCADNVRPHQGTLGLKVSPLAKLAAVSGKPGVTTIRRGSMLLPADFAKSAADLSSLLAGTKPSDLPTLPSVQHAEAEHEKEVVEPNAISIAINSSSGDCVHHILHSVLGEKVSLRGSRYQRGPPC